MGYNRLGNHGVRQKHSFCLIYLKCFFFFYKPSKYKNFVFFRDLSWFRIIFCTKYLKWLGVTVFFVGQVFLKILICIKYTINLYMVFADNVVLIDKNTNALEGKIKRCEEILEKRE